MEIKFKGTNKKGTAKIEILGEIREVMVNENFTNPDKETIAICVKGLKSSGDIELTTKEFENINNVLKN